MTREELQARAEEIASEQGAPLVISLLLDYLERGYYMDLFRALDDGSVENLTFIR